MENKISELEDRNFEITQWKFPWIQGEAEKYELKSFNLLIYLCFIQYWNKIFFIPFELTL